MMRLSYFYMDIIKSFFSLIFGVHERVLVELKDTFFWTKFTTPKQQT